MLVDLVLDTNVLAHAQNPEHAFFRESRALAIKLIAEGATTVLRVDPGYNAVEGQNRSKIVGEYLRILTHGTLGYHVVQVLATTQRLRPTPLSTDQNIKTTVRKLVCDNSDRIFLMVALGSESRLLASHDDVAFDDSVRESCRDLWAVEICDAPEVLPRL